MEKDPYKAKKRLRKYLKEELFKRAISNICKNALKGNIKFKSGEIRLLKPDKKRILKYSKCENLNPNEVVQKGYGLLSILLPIVIPILNAILNQK